MARIIPLQKLPHDSELFLTFSGVEGVRGTWVTLLFEDRRETTTVYCHTVGLYSAELETFRKALGRPQTGNIWELAGRKIRASVQSRGSRHKVDWYPHHIGTIPTIEQVECWGRWVSKGRWKGTNQTTQEVTLYPRSGVVWFTWPETIGEGHDYVLAPYTAEDDEIWALPL